MHGVLGGWEGVGKACYKVIILVVLLEERLCQKICLPAFLERSLVFVYCVLYWHLNLLLCQQLKASDEDFTTVFFLWLSLGEKSGVSLFHFHLLTPAASSPW